MESRKPMKWLRKDGVYKMTQINKRNIIGYSMIITTPAGEVDIRYTTGEELDYIWPHLNHDEVEIKEVIMYEI